jgi:hypothetical protein
LSIAISRKWKLWRDLEHDPEKWKPVFPRDKRETRLREIMLEQSDEMMMRFHLIAS